MRGVGFIFALLALVGCKTTDDFVGAGPISLSSHATDAYQKHYQKETSPMVFLVTQDGQYSHYAYCRGGLGDCDGGKFVFDTIDKCTSKAGRQCYILASKGSIVWRGSVLFSDGTQYQPDGTVAQRPSSLATLSDDKICERALDLSTKWAQWSAREASPTYVFEATARGLTPADCTSLRLDTMTDAELCQLILLQRNGKPEWVGGRLYRYIWRAEARGLTPSSCDQLLAAS